MHVRQQQDLDFTAPHQSAWHPQVGLIQAGKDRQSTDIQDFCIYVTNAGCRFG